MKCDADAELIQRREVCDHPEELCVRSPEDVTGMFYIHCKKCDTVFSRYTSNELFENRKKYGNGGDRG